MTTVNSIYHPKSLWLMINLLEVEGYYIIQALIDVDQEMAEDIYFQHELEEYFSSCEQ
jgi:hypothetical protein